MSGPVHGEAAGRAEVTVATSLRARSPQCTLSVMRETNRASDEMNRDLSEQVANGLDAFANERVSVRVVTASDDLIAVFSGTLGPRSDEKSPSLFWPVEVDAHLGERERPASTR